MPDPEQDIGETGPLTLTVETTFEERYRAMRAIGGREPLGKRVWFWALVTLVAAMVVAGLAMEGSRSLLGVRGLMAVLLGALAVYPFAERRLMRKLLDRPEQRGPVTYAFSDDGIRIAAGGAETLYRWERVVGVRETAEFLLFQVGSDQRMVVSLPRRALRDAGDARRLGEIVRRHVPGAELTV